MSKRSRQEDSSPVLFLLSSPREAPQEWKMGSSLKPKEFEGPGRRSGPAETWQVFSMGLSGNSFYPPCSPIIFLRQK
jgi:hypothetical protein